MVMILQVFIIDINENGPKKPVWFVMMFYIGWYTSLNVLILTATRNRSAKYVYVW